MHSFKSILKACRRYYEAGRLAAQCPGLRKSGMCRLAYEDDPVRFGYHRCAIGAGLTLAECRAGIAGHQFVNAPDDQFAALLRAHDYWLQGVRTKRQFLATLTRLERKYGL